MPKDGKRIPFTSILTPRQAMAVRLHVYGKMPVSEAAASMGVNLRCFLRILSKAYSTAYDYEQLHGTGTMAIGVIEELSCPVSMETKPTSRGKGLGEIPTGLAARMYDSDGMKVSEIAQRLGCQKSTVYNALRRDGLDIRKTSGRIRPMDPRTLDAIGKRRQ